MPKDNKDRAKYRREYYLRNRERIRAQQREYYRNNREHIREQQKTYYRIFKEKINERHNKWRRDTPGQRVIHNMRSSIRRALNGLSKGGHTTEIIGCSISHLRLHLEVQFKKGMSWDNYGSEWHIDHRIPIHAFDVDNPAELKTCFHFSNLQPMWASDNCSKGGKVCLES